MSDLREMLKPGRAIKMRNGEYYLILDGDRWISFESGYCDSEGYNENLDDVECDPEWDIMVIYVPGELYDPKELFDISSWKEIWKREIPKVTMTLAEIETRLGITPGTLLIK